MRKSVQGTAFFGFALVAALVSGGMAVALTAAAPSRATELIAQARPGQTVVLPAGTGGTLTISNRVFSPAIHINAAAATLDAIIIRSSSGIIIDRGTIVGSGVQSRGVMIDRSNNITVSNMRISGAHDGVVLNKSDDIRVIGNVFDGVQSDGIDIAQSHRVLVQNNECRNFHPTPPVYSATGTLITDGDHPDCIQSWSHADLPPTSDIQIIGNRMNGLFQGIFFGNNVVNGISEGGFDRVTISNNVIVGGFPNALYLDTARDSGIMNNRISTVPGARLPIPPRFWPVNAELRVYFPTRLTACGNSVANAAPGTVGLQACR